MAFLQKEKLFSREWFKNAFLTVFDAYDIYGEGFTPFDE